MTNPTPDNDRPTRQGQTEMVTAVTALMESNQESARQAASLVEAVREETAARDRKVAALADQTDVLAGQSTALHATVKTLKRAIVGLALALVLLLGLAGLNVYNTTTTADIARDTARTNEIIAGCLVPNSECTENNQRATSAVLDQIAQRQFVIAVCQRENPVDKDPTGAGLKACITDYYPTFQLPPRN